MEEGGKGGCRQLRGQGMPPVLTYTTCDYFCTQLGNMCELCRCVIREPWCQSQQLSAELFFKLAEA